MGLAGADAFLSGILAVRRFDGAIERDPAGVITDGRLRAWALTGAVADPPGLA
jgi:hypothetical protein